MREYATSRNMVLIKNSASVCTTNVVKQILFSSLDPSVGNTLRSGWIHTLFLCGIWWLSEIHLFIWKTFAGKLVKILSFTICGSFEKFTGKHILIFISFVYVCACACVYMLLTMFWLANTWATLHYTQLGIVPICCCVRVRACVRACDPAIVTFSVLISSPENLFFVLSFMDHWLCGTGCVGDGSVWVPRRT